MAEFELVFSNSTVPTHDRFDICVNDVSIGTYDLSTDLLRFQSVTEPGWNSLCVLFDRTVPGTFVHVDEIFINNCAMKYLANDFGQVIPNYTRDPGLEQWFVDTQGQAPGNFPKRKLLDMPGRYHFRFFMPLKKFLDDFYVMPDVYAQHYNAPIDRFLQLEKRLKTNAPNTRTS